MMMFGARMQQKMKNRIESQEANLTERELEEQTMYSDNWIRHITQQEGNEENTPTTIYMTHLLDTKFTIPQ